MVENSKIEWTDDTFNPVVGCTRISPGCDNCYAEAIMKRYGKPELWLGERRRTTPSNWAKPLRWNKAAQASQTRRKVFCASLADVFDNGWNKEWRDDLWSLIRITPWLDWQLLTKRPQNITRMLPEDWGDGWRNVWLGTTIESGEYLSRLSTLLLVPGNQCLRFISYEPAIGPFDRLSDAWIKGDTSALDWLICGGESGPKKRPMDLNWARSIRDQCAKQDVPFFFKQVDKVQAIPPDLLIRQFPKLRMAGVV